MTSPPGRRTDCPRVNPSVAQQLRALCPDALADDAPVLVWVRAPSPAPLLAGLVGGGQPWVSWSPAGDDTAWRVEGAGSAWAVRAASLAAVRAECLPRLRATRVVRGPGVREAPEPRAFFAARFDPTDRRNDPAWEGFPIAWALAPQVLLARRPNGTLLLGWQGTAGQLRALDALPHAPEAPNLPQPSPGLQPEARTRWDALVAAALADFETGALEKVVAARREPLEGPWGVGRGAVPSAVLGALDGALAGRSGVAFGLCPGGGAGVFVGATPECLVRRRGDGVEADALAGSMPRGSGWEAQAAALRTSEKDLREHALVRDAVVSALDPLCTAVTHPAVPTVRVLPTVLHLYSRVTGTLRDTTAGDVLALTDALHPTPAVCGTPREAARAFIAAHEDAPRGWYAGPVGWVDAAGEGEAMVALRSAVVCGATAWAYAGAGLVRGSDAAQEWRETDAKLGPMRAALGAGAA